jgi:PAS domain S-box-containing protein
MENTAEIKRLQSCINDLISVLALPAIWSGSESSQILGTLLDVLLTMLRLDFAYARLSDASEAPAIELVRLSGHRHSSVHPRQFGQALNRWLTDDQAASGCVIPHPAGDGEVSIASYSLGLQQDGNMLVAGSRRADFPTEVERLLLRVAANQAGMGLQEARRSGEQKRIAEMLEGRVADRTKRLTAVNDDLRRSEAYLAEAQRLSRTGSFGWRLSTGELIWSEETFRIFQYDRTTIPTVGLILQRVHPEDLALVKQTIERAAQDGKDFEHEYRLRMPDGSVEHVHVVARALNDESGSVEFVGAVMDVTAAKEAEKTLRESEAYLAEAQRLTHTGSWVWRVAGRDALHLSEEWYRVYGFDPEAGVPTWEERLQRIHPEDRNIWQATIDRAINEKSDYEVEFRILLPSGTVRYIHTVGHPVMNASRDLVQFVGSSVDVTERRRAEAFREGESRILEMIARDVPLEKILESLVHVVESQFAGSLCSVLLLDEDCQHVRHGAATSLPKPYSDAIDGLCIGPKAGSCGTAMYRRETVVVTDILQDPLWEAYRDVAEPYGLRACWSTPILEHSGKALGSFAMYYREPRNPTPAETRALEMATHLAGIAIERKHAREERERLRQLQAELAHINRVTTMGELTASLAHEVNQPIAAAVTDANTCLRWLNRDQPDLEEARQAASRIVKDATRAGEIVSRIRLVFKKGAPERALVDVNEVIRELIVLLHSEATRYSISVRAELGDLPPVMGDRVQLQQVLMNLMINGIDAMKEVDRTRELVICSQQAEDGQLTISVSDTGVGLPPRQADKVFNAFFTTKPHGTGMGLRISRSIVESHGGRLWAAHSSPHGASFHLTLPIAAETQKRYA